MSKYIDADRLKAEIRRLKTDVYDEAQLFDIGTRSSLTFLESFIDSLQQEQPDKEFLNESQQEFVNIVTERMLKEGPIPTLKGKQKAEFEKEFNRFKQITGMVNWPAYEEIYKKIILWFMAWGADNLPNLGKPIDLDKMDIQQEQPLFPDNLDDAANSYASKTECAVVACRGFKAGAEWQYRKDKYEFSKLKTKEWMSGYSDGLSDFCWHSVDDFLPKVDQEVIVLTDELGTAPIYKIAFGHIVDRTRCSDYNGWNIPGVKFWMFCPTIPKEEENETK